MASMHYFIAAHQDKGIRFPVGRSNLVGQPGSDRFGRFDAEFGDGLRNVFDSIQQPLGRIVVVFQKAIRLNKGKTNKCMITEMTASKEALAFAINEHFLTKFDLIHVSC